MMELLTIMWPVFTSMSAVPDITQILQELVMEGHKIEEDTIAALSPYMTHNINRFGRYNLDLNRKPPNIDYTLSLATA